MQPTRSMHLSLPLPPSRPGRTLLAWLACALLGAACSSDSDGGAFVGVVGPAGGIVEVRSGELAGTAIAVDAGVLVQDQALRIEPASAQELSGLVAVGPAARMVPVDLVALSTVTLVIDATVPAFVSSNPATDLVVVRVAADGQVEVLTPDSLDLGAGGLEAGRVSARVAGFGTFWAAVRDTAQAFSLANFLPQEGDSYEYGNHYVFYLRDANGDPGLGQGDWRGWNQTFGGLLPQYPNSGVYVALQPDGSLLFGGSYSQGSGFLGADHQRLATEPLVVPPAVVEGEEYTSAGGLDVFVPFGATTAIPKDGLVRVRIGERGARSVPAGTFGDVVRIDFEVELRGQLVWHMGLDLARGVGPIAIEDALGIFELIRAQARGRIYE